MLNFHDEKKKRKGKQNKRKTHKNKQANKQKRQGGKGYTKNPGVSALTMSGTPWCNGGLSNLYLWTFHLKFTFFFMKKESARNSGVFKW